MKPTTRLARSGSRVARGGTNKSGDKSSGKPEKKSDYELFSNFSKIKDATEESKNQAALAFLAAVPEEKKSENTTLLTVLVNGTDEQILQYLVSEYNDVLGLQKNGRELEAKAKDETLRKLIVALSSISPRFGREYAFLERYLTSLPPERKLIYDSASEKNKKFYDFFNTKYNLPMEEPLYGPDVPPEGTTTMEESDEDLEGEYEGDDDVTMNPASETKETKGDEKNRPRKMSLESTSTDITPSPDYSFSRSETPKVAPRSLLGQNEKINTVLVETLKNLSSTEGDLAQAEKKASDLDQKLKERETAASKAESDKVKNLQSSIDTLKNQLRILRNQYNQIDLSNVVGLDSIDVQFIQNVLEELERQLTKNSNLTFGQLWSILFLGFDGNRPIFSDLLILRDTALELTPIQLNIAPRQVSGPDEKIQPNQQDLNTRTNNLGIFFSVVTNSGSPEAKLDVGIPLSASWKPLTQKRLSESAQYLADQMKPFLWFQNRRFEQLVTSLKSNKGKIVKVSDAITPSPIAEGKRS